MENKLFSIVVPVYCSKDILGTLVERISAVMRRSALSFELILVDDGSSDGSFEEIKRLSSDNGFVRGFRLSRNFGHQAALIIGLRESRGDVVAVIDDDLQDPPEVLPRFFEEIEKGANVVYGVRKLRKENIFRRWSYSSFYKILDLLSSVEIPKNAGDFCAMKRQVVNVLLQLNDANPFLRGTRAWAGFKQIGVEYERSARHKGKSGYGFFKYLDLAVTGLLMFSYIPLRISTYLGLTAALFAFLYAVVMVVWSLLEPFKVPGFLSLIIFVTFLGGVQLITIGVMGEYIARLNDNVRKWPVAIIAESTEGVER